MLQKTIFSVITIFVGSLIVASAPFAGIRSGFLISSASTGMNYPESDLAIATPDSKDELFDYSLVLKDLKGNTVTMEQFKGKVIFINEWATWCGPCRAEMPSIQKLYDNVSKENLVFVMLSRDQPGDTPKILKYINSRAFNFPVYQPTGDLPKQLDSPSIPATYLISKAGKIVRKEIGIINAGEFKTLLEKEAAK